MIGELLQKMAEPMSAKEKLCAENLHQGGTNLMSHFGGVTSEK
jgi:hypothetical protein